MEEIMYGSEQFKKKNGYSRKKPLTPTEKKERNEKRQSKLFMKLEHLDNTKSTHNTLKSLEDTHCTTTSSDKPNINDLKALVSNIQNK